MPPSSTRFPLCSLLVLLGCASPKGGAVSSKGSQVPWSESLRMGRTMKQKGKRKKGKWKE